MRTKVSRVMEESLALQRLWVSHIEPCFWADSKRAASCWKNCGGLRGQPDEHGWQAYGRLIDQLHEGGRQGTSSSLISLYSWEIWEQGLAAKSPRCCAAPPDPSVLAFHHACQASACGDRPV